MEAWTQKWPSAVIWTTIVNVGSGGSTVHLFKVEQHSMASSPPGLFPYPLWCGIPHVLPAPDHKFGRLGKRVL